MVVKGILYACVQVFGARGISIEGLIKYRGNILGEKIMSLT